MKTWAIALAIAGTALVVVGAALALGGSNEEARCGEGFGAHGARCCPGGGAGSAANTCNMQVCARPLVMSDGTCDAPDTRVLVPLTSALIGPSDWEAEGRVAPRTVTAGPFEIDAFEVTMGKLRCPSCPSPSSAFDPHDAARAAFAVTRDEARAYCKLHGGRLPTDDEWIVAAVGPAASRYPWGDTGAVCRRAAFGLVNGPCGHGADGPDTAGAHPLGDTKRGIHDLAGNVAEWVEAERPLVRGGSYASNLATELRTWAREEIDPAARDPRVGFRCAYAAK